MNNYIKKKSLKQEQRTAKDFLGRTTPASGALANAKGDVKTDIFLIENKYTDKDKYKLDITTWKKIEQEAIREGLRIPMMQIDIQDLELVVLDINDMLVCTHKEYFKDTDCLFTQGKSFLLKLKDLMFLKYEPVIFNLHLLETTLSIMEKDQFMNLLDND